MPGLLPVRTPGRKRMNCPATPGGNGVISVAVYVAQCVKAMRSFNAWHVRRPPGSLTLRVSSGYGKKSYAACGNTSARLRRLPSALRHGGQLTAQTHHIPENSVARRNTGAQEPAGCLGIPGGLLPPNFTGGHDEGSIPGRGANRDRFLLHD